MQVKVKITSKHWLLLLMPLLLTTTMFAQSVGIGTTSPSPQAQLEVSSTNQGFLAPRMDSLSRKNIPATMGLIVYDNTYDCYWYHNGTAWVNIPPAGTNAGELLYWSGNRWVTLSQGLPGQFLTVSATTLLPVWAGAGTVALSTAPAASITTTTAVSGGTIGSDGGAPITAKGVVWSTAPNPTIALGTKTNDGSGSGTFSSNLTGLIAGYTYYMRAYATNANGTSYGNEVNFVASGSGTYTIGQLYGGGVVFYVDASGQHGLIAALTDQSIGVGWYTGGGSSTVTGATGVGIGTGAANTTTVIGVQGTGSYAASLCRLYYSGGGFTDWYLPSFYELDKLFLQRNNLPGLLTPLTSFYWSSSEINNITAWAVDFNSSGPNQNMSNKVNTVKVRAIRAF
jgi:hypothetical protein